jgi:hypothetical protein
MKLVHRDVNGICSKKKIIELDRKGKEMKGKESNQTYYNNSSG